MEEKEALYYEKLDGLKIRCRLCPHMCGVADGAAGKCGLRENRGGVLFALSYGRTVTVNVDPIEKKPLYHFMPGSVILSIGPNGCTFACDNCQNWHISQERSPTQFISPEELVRLSSREGSIGVAFTYTEPLLWFEYLKDAAPLLREKGLKSVIVTNGFLNEEPARELAPLIDGFNVDLKGIRDEFYKTYCGGRVEPVKRFIEIASAVSHVEVTNLVIPGLNDSRKDFEDLAAWLAAVSPEVPLHFSRFFPQYRMTDRSPTSEKTLREAYDIARKKLHYVYVGNIFIDGTEDTHCAKCGAVVVRRVGYTAEVLGPKGICPSCGAQVKGVWI
ncbi:MAG: AmmeMemoRadiSam system radical SAM enzyme [Candidatus Krumholzibacteria bacterium]|nr:AmmeMemoRadiSam system radical SAM enzyme [Candidatus Krumholzibacteria bacterium]